MKSKRTKIRLTVAEVAEYNAIHNTKIRALPIAFTFQGSELVEIAGEQLAKGYEPVAMNGLAIYAWLIRWHKDSSGRRLRSSAR